MTRDELLTLIRESGETTRDGFLQWARARGRTMSNHTVNSVFGSWRDALRAAMSAPPPTYSRRTEEPVRTDESAPSMRVAHTPMRSAYTHAADEPRTRDELPGLDDVRLPVLPDEIDLEALIARRRSQYGDKVRAKDARKLAPIYVDHDSRYTGLYFCGDPHVDDDGTDLGGLLDELETVTSLPGIVRVNVGDSWNAWAGRLARLYSEQSTSAAEALALVKHMLEAGKWHLVIGGNHDLWAGASDPIARECVALGQWYEPHGARFRLVSPRGEIRVNARHQFAGNSQWNAAHAVSKYAQIGIRDHVLVAGHLHVSGYAPVVDPDSRIICHCVQVASWKIHDRYADERGFMNKAISPSAFLIVDWEAPESARVTLHWDAAIGVERLRALRDAERRAA